MFIQDFYSNIQAIDTFVPRFTALVHGTCILTLELISEVLHVPRLAILDYLRSLVLQSLSRDALVSHFCERPSLWGSILSMVSRDFARDPRVFNMMMKFIHTPCSHYNTITKVHARFLSRDPQLVYGDIGDI